MRDGLWLLVAGAMLVSVTAAAAESASPNNINGEQWLRSPAAYQQGYIQGVLDLQFGDNPIEPGSPMASCMQGRSTTQIVAIYEKFLRDNPDRWNYAAYSTLIVALAKSCGL